jgi:hypothetical protein
MNDKELEKIEKIIESSHINFMIGSGTSKDFLDTLWNIESLLTEYDKEKKETPQYKLIEASIKYWYFEKCMRGNLKLIDNDFLLSAEKDKQFEETCKNYDDFIKAINIILLKRKTNLVNKQVNLFTTNMDLFLDKTLDKLNIEFNDGFSGKFESSFSTSNYQKTVFKNSFQYNVQAELPLFNLFKLHGSLTWKQVKDEKIVYDSKLIALGKLNKISFDPDKDLLPLENEFSKLVHLSTAKKEIVLDKHIKFLEEFKNLIMINPTKEKFESTTLRLEYYEQLRMYSNALEKENSVLFVCGFSFADEHLKEITLRAANSNPTLIIYIFCFNEDEKNKIQALLKISKFNNIKYLCAFSFSKTVNNVFIKIASKLDTKSYQLVVSETKEDSLEAASSLIETKQKEDEPAK